MSRADLDAKVCHENHIFTALRGEGWAGNTQQLRQIAHKGEELRRRWEAACNYPWAADESGAYVQATANLELALIGFCAQTGLYCHLQGDCRGVPIYVAMHPLNDTNYSGHGFALYWEE